PRRLEEETPGPRSRRHRGRRVPRRGCAVRITRGDPTDSCQCGVPDPKHAVRIIGATAAAGQHNSEKISLRWTTMWVSRAHRVEIAWTRRAILVGRGPRADRARDATREGR